MGLSKDKNYSFIPWLIVIGVIGLALYTTRDKASNWYPTSKQGMDTIYAGDSVYVINFKIDTAYKLEREVEPKETPY